MFVNEIHRVLSLIYVEAKVRTHPNASSLFDILHLLLQLWISCESFGAEIFYRYYCNVKTRIKTMHSPFSLPPWEAPRFVIWLHCSGAELMVGVLILTIFHVTGPWIKIIPLRGFSVISPPFPSVSILRSDLWRPILQHTSRFWCVYQPLRSCHHGNKLKADCNKNWRQSTVNGW